MASLVLTAVGTYVAGPVGGAVGAAVGGYIDRQYLFPALFPEDDVQGERLDSLQLSAGSEGAPFNRCYGSKTRVSGTYIWVSQIREVTRVTEVGKGGLTSEEVEETLLVADCAIAFSDTAHLPGGSISDITKIYFNANLAFDNDATTTLTDTTTKVRVENDSIVAQNDSVRYPRYISASGGPDMRLLRSSSSINPVVVSGFSVSANNGTLKIPVFRGEASGETFCTMIDFLADTDRTEAASGTTKTFAQTLPEFDPDLFSSITIYDGSQTTADPTISAAEGSSTTPAFIHTAYVLIKDLQLNGFGGRFPSSVEAIVEAESSLTLANAIKRMMEEAGRVDGTDFDVSRVSGDLTGYTARGLVTPSQQIQQLMIAFDIIVQDRDGVLTFMDRTDADTITVASGDLAAHERGAGGQEPRDVNFDDTGYRDVPKSVTVTYVDTVTSDGFGSQIYQRINASTGANLRYRFDISMTGAQAQCIGRRIAWQGFANALGMSVNLPPSYLKAVEGDTLIVTSDDGESRRLAVDLLDVGANELRIYRGVEEIIETQNFEVADCIVEDPRTPPDEFYLQGPPALAIMQIPALLDRHTTIPGFYWAVAAFDDSEPWRGVQLYRDKSPAITWDSLAGAGNRATMGRALTSLPGPENVNEVDTVNTVDIELFHGTISSSTLQAVLEGHNRFIIGEELIGAVDVTSIGTNRYRLGQLLRGLRDTEDETLNHVTGDRVVYLSNRAFYWFEQTKSEFGTDYDYRAVAGGDDVLNGFTQYTNLDTTLRTLRPFRPAHVRGSRDPVSDDVTIEWDRRTRAIYNPLSGNPLPQLEPVLEFEVDILSGAGGSVLRTINGTATANGSVVDSENLTATYDAADELADGLSPTNDLFVRVYQISSCVGRSAAQGGTIVP